MRVHEENALRVAGFLAGDPRVACVFHPSLPAHPGHEIARRQQSGFGAMLAFEIADPDRGCGAGDGGSGAVAAFLGALRCFSLAESLGGVESLVAHPATMTHAAMDEAARTRAGITPRLLRLSIGIEDAGDLIADLDQALAASAAARSPALS
jgi:cystathionine gamma-synthase